MDTKEEKINDNSNITANSKQLDILKKNFPNCFDKEGNFIAHKMEEIVRGSGLELSRESYSLNWLGKSYARLLANENPRTMLREDKEHNALEENKTSQNILIKGDNLEVLKHLKNAYEGAVKMIYIDPPYNTGSDGFVYNDDRKFTIDELSQLAGVSYEEAKRIMDFTASKSNSHSAWLTFMYPRLYIARELLQDDGVIFISIDDNEASQLKLLCDEIFGEENFVAQIPWRKRTAKSDVPFGVSQDFEWIFCYAKEQFLAGIAHERKYYYTDDYPNDGWRLSDLTTQKVEGDRPNSAFDLVDPKTSKVYPYNPKRLWGITKDTFADYYSKGKIVFPDDYDFLKIGIPAYRVFESEDKAKALKKYGIEDGIKAASTQLPKDVGMSENGNKDIISLFNNKLFSYPKPVSLISFLIDLINNKDEGFIILDFFAGSGTTAHAVMELNAQDGGNRKFIAVQIAEATDEKSEAYKAGYQTIFDITKERIIRASAKIKAEIAQDNTKDSNDFDWGFKIFETTPLFENPLDTMDAFEETTPQLFDASMLTNEDFEALLTSWKLYDRMKLTEELQEITLANYKAYYGDKKLYFVHGGFESEDLKALILRLDEDKSFQPNKLILFGYSFDSKYQREISEALNSYTNKKSIEIDMIVRY